MRSERASGIRSLERSTAPLAVAILVSALSLGFAKLAPPIRIAPLDTARLRLIVPRAKVPRSLLHDPPLGNRNWRAAWPRNHHRSNAKIYLTISLLERVEQIFKKE